jgi:hypothetical protein
LGLRCSASAAARNAHTRIHARTHAQHGVGTPPAPRRYVPFSFSRLTSLLARDSLLEVLRDGRVEVVQRLERRAAVAEDVALDEVGERVPELVGHVHARGDGDCVRVCAG